MAGEPTSGVDTAQKTSTGRTAKWRDVVHTAYNVVRANPTGRVALKILIAILGGAVVVTGIALIPLPGPGWALVLLGLSIWAIEFVWARHLLRFTRRQLTRWVKWMTAQPWPIRLLVGGVGLVFVTVVFALSLEYSFGIDVWSSCWNYIATH